LNIIRRERKEIKSPKFNLKTLNLRLEIEFYRTTFWQFLSINRFFARERKKERRIFENINLCRREKTQCVARERKKTNGCSHTFPRIHEIFQNLALKEKKRKKSPWMRTPTQVQYVSQMCISILRIVPWCVEHVGRKTREFANIKWRRLARAALYVHHVQLRTANCYVACSRRSENLFHNMKITSLKKRNESKRIDAFSIDDIFYYGISNLGS